jgi:excisionase family DNA binding protein
MPEPIVYTPLDVADKLQLGRTKVFELLRTGELQSVLIGRSRRILPEQLEAYMERLRSGFGPMAKDETSTAPRRGLRRTTTSTK